VADNELKPAWWKIQQRSDTSRAITSKPWKNASLFLTVSYNRFALIWPAVISPMAISMARKFYPVLLYRRNLSTMSLAIDRIKSEPTRSMMESAT